MPPLKRTGSTRYIRAHIYTIPALNCDLLDYLPQTSNEHARPNVPANHAGHQMHHTATCVHMPQTFQPKAASVSTLWTETFHALHAARKTVLGARRLTTTKPATTLAITLAVVRFVTLGPSLFFRDFKSVAADGVALESIYPTNESGAQTRPRNRDREKFSVARAERKRPRRRSENDLMRRNC